MKTPTYFSLCCLMLLCSCNRPTIHHEVVVDITDPLDAGPWSFTSADWIGIYGLDEYPSRGVSVDFTTASEVRYTSQWNCKLAAGWPRLVSNHYDRKLDIEKFAERCAKISGSLQPTGSLSRSRIFHQIADRLHELSISTAEERVLWYYGDLAEHGDSVSAYGEGQEKLLNWMEREVILPRLDGVTVHLIHKARDYADGQRFEHLAGKMAELIAAAGGTTVISAEIDPE